MEPPQTIISAPVHTAVWLSLAAGTPGSEILDLTDDLVVAPDGTVYVGYWALRGGGGGVARSDDGGRTFIVLPGIAGQAVKALALAPSDPETVIAGTLAGVFRSQNGGRSWRRISAQDHPELRNVPFPEEPLERIRVVMRELLTGPATSQGLAPVVPYQAQLEAVFIDSDGNAFVALTAPPDPLQGSSTELLLAYGVVDSILLNCPTINAVQILFGGREVPTLTGHLDFSKPLVLNKRFIAAS